MTVGERMNISQKQNERTKKYPNITIYSTNHRVARQNYLTWTRSSYRVTIFPPKRGTDAALERRAH